MTKCAAAPLAGAELAALCGTLGTARWRLYFFWLVRDNAPMRRAGVFLALSFGMLSIPTAETLAAESAPLAPNLQPPAAWDSSAQSVAPLSRGASDGTAITELTVDGRQIFAPTADRPAYVVTHSGGQHDFGQVAAGEKAPVAETLDQQVETALGRLHYLRADAGHPPSLLIVFSWVVHCLPGDEFEDRGYRNLLDRAALVGG